MVLLIVFLDSSEGHGLSEGHEIEEIHSADSKNSEEPIIIHISE